MHTVKQNSFAFEFGKFSIQSFLKVYLNNLSWAVVGSIKANKLLAYMTLWSSVCLYHKSIHVLCIIFKALSDRLATHLVWFLTFAKLTAKTILWKKLWLRQEKKIFWWQSNIWQSRVSVGSFVRFWKQMLTCTAPKKHPTMLWTAQVFVLNCVNYAFAHLYAFAYSDL